MLLRMSGSGAEANWLLAAFAVITGNGKNWVGSRPTASGDWHGRAKRREVSGVAVRRLLDRRPAETDICQRCWDRQWCLQSPKEECTFS